MKHEVPYRCGHTGTRIIKGDESAQKKWLDTLAAQDCPMCWLKAQPVEFSGDRNNRVTVHRGYPIKEELKARGYRWQRPLWSIKFRSSEGVASELVWAANQGYRVQWPESLPPDLLSRGAEIASARPGWMIVGPSK